MRLIFGRLTVLPFEFVTFGKPISQQTKDKSRLQSWQASVRRSVKSVWQAPPLDEPLLITMTHFYDVGSSDESGVPDSDNIIKPVRQVLVGLVFVPNLAVIDFISRRRNLGGSFRVRGISPVLARGFCKGQGFLHVRIEASVDPNIP